MSKPLFQINNGDIFVRKGATQEEIKKDDLSTLTQEQIFTALDKINPVAEGAIKKADLFSFLYSKKLVMNIKALPKITVQEICMQHPSIKPDNPMAQKMADVKNSIKLNNIQASCMAITSSFESFNSGIKDGTAMLTGCHKIYLENIGKNTKSILPDFKF